MPAQTIRLETNIPVVGTPKYIDYRPGRGEGQYGPKPDQISINGDWGKSGSGVIYLHVALEERLKELGVITGARNGDNYILARRGVQLHIVKKENGNKRFTEINLADGNGQPSGAPQQAAPSGSSASHPATQQAGKPFAGEKLTFNDLVRGLGNSIVAVKKLIEEHKLDSSSVAAIANTLFIQAVKEGMIRHAPPLISKEQLDVVAALCTQVGHDDKWLNELLERRFKVDTVYKLPASGANTLILELQAELKAIEERKARAAQEPAGYLQHKEPAYEDIPF